MRARAGATAFLAAILAAAAALAAPDALEDLRSADPGARARGRAALEADTGGSLLLRALKAPEGIVRTAAAEVLAAKPDRISFPLRGALRDTLRDREADATARAAAAAALAAARDGGAVPDLVAALPDLPRAAALALAEVGDSTALEPLRRLRERDAARAPPEVGYALARLGDASGEDLLLARLEGADADAGAAAVHLLRRLTGKDLGTSAASWREAVRIRRLAAALADRDWDRSEAAFVEARARGSAAAGDLLAVLQDGSSPRESRGKAALGLGLLGGPEAGPALLEAAKIGEDPWVRVYSLEALGRIAWAPAAPVVARMLVNDEDPEVPKSFFDSSTPYHNVQGAAARCLLEMGCEGALGAAVDEISRGGAAVLPTACVNDYRIRVYWDAMAMLRDFGGPGAKDGFAFLPEAGETERAASAARAVAWWKARPRDLAVKVRARFDDPLFVARVHREIEILGQYKFLEMDRSRRALMLLGTPAVPHLVAALSSEPAKDPSGQTRIGAAQVLASIGHPGAVAPLRAALSRAEISPVRCQALLALAALAPSGGVPEALRLLASASADERAAASEALALCPTPASADAVRRALAAPGLDGAQRIALATALLAVRDPGGMPALLGFLGDEDVILRRRAWEGMDRWIDGLGPHDPDAGTSFDLVKKRWETQQGSPRFRERTVPAR